MHDQAQSPIQCSETTSEERLLAERVEAARQAWPGVRLPDTVFIEYLVAHLPDGDALGKLAAMNTRELYLACGCVRGDACAIDYLEAEHFCMIEAAVARINDCSDFIDEVKQTVREEALVSSPNKPAALERYSGRGALGGWLRVMAVRTALRLIRKRGGGRDPDLAHHIPAPVADPELEHLRNTYRQEFRRALGDALRGLDHKQRNLLRYHYIDGLTIDELAILYRVHRATVARRIARTRQAIFEAMRQALIDKLGVGSTECDSILRLMRSQLDITLSEVLVGRVCVNTSDESEHAGAS